MSILLAEKVEGLGGVEVGSEMRSEIKFGLSLRRVGFSWNVFRGGR